MTSPLNTQTVVALVENEAGVLARVVGLFARRGFNICSLAVAPTNDERFSRITFVYDIGSAPVEQVVSQVSKLINVISIEAVDPHQSIERELLLATVNLDEANRSALFELVQEYEGKIVDIGSDSITIMIATRPERLDDFEGTINDYGIVALQRTGRIALPVAERESAQLVRSE